MAVAVLKQNTHCNFRHNFDLQRGSWDFEIGKGAVFWRRFRFSGQFWESAPSMALTRPIYTHPAGWRRYNFPEKLAESKFGLFWGYLSARNSNFLSILFIRPAMVVDQPHLFTSSRVEGGTTYRQNGGKQNMYAFGVLFGKEFEFFVYIVHPPRHGGHRAPFIPIQYGGGGTTYRQNGGKQSMYALGVLFGKEFEFFVYIVHPPRHGGHPHHLYSSSRVEGEGYNLPQKLRKIRAVCCRSIFGRRIRLGGPSILAVTCTPSTLFEG